MWGKLVRLLSESEYLEYIKQTTFAQGVYPEREFRHIAIFCLNHILDVISFDLPKIRQLRSSEATYPMQ